MFNFNNLNNINEVINLLSKEFNHQKLFILSLNQLICLGKTQFIPTFGLINNNLPHLMDKLGLPFCDLMNNNFIINYYVNIYKTTKEPKIKNILIISQIIVLLLGPLTSNQSTKLQLIH
jgi:hypothetical protein